MKKLFRKYLIGVLALMLGSFFQLSLKASENVDFSVATLNVFSGQHSSHLVHKNSLKQHVNNSGQGEHSKCELIEQTVNSFQKDLIDDTPWFFGLKNYNSNFLSLLSRSLSGYKPFLVTYSGEAIYIALCVFRL